MGAWTQESVLHLTHCKKEEFETIHMLLFTLCCQILEKSARQSVFHCGCQIGQGSNPCTVHAVHWRLDTLGWKHLRFRCWIEPWVQTSLQQCQCLCRVSNNHSAYLQSQVSVVKRLREWGDWLPRYCVGQAANMLQWKPYFDTTELHIGLQKTIHANWCLWGRHNSGLKLK